MNIEDFPESIILNWDFKAFCSTNLNPYDSLDCFQSLGIIDKD